MPQLLPLVHFIEWKNIPDAEIPRRLDEWAAAGVTRLVAHPLWALREAAVPGYLRRLQAQLQARRLQTPAAHALWGADHDLGCPDPSLRQAAVARHAAFMRHLAAMGTTTYTLHLGLHAGNPAPWDPVRHALDLLLPVAEETAITLCLENGNEPTHELQRLCHLVTTLRHPQLATCFDTGHAHCYNPEGILFWLNLFAPTMQTCHWHDNGGKHDDHLTPGAGNISWTDVLPRLKAAPNLRHVETESGNWQVKDWQTFLRCWSTSP